jgi:hypothetical protein
MRLTPLRALLAAALTGCGAGTGPSLSGPDTVYVSPRFTEAVSPDLIPQIQDFEWSLEGTTSGWTALPEASPGGQA